MKHSEVTPPSVHPPWFYQESDPGAVGEGKVWVQPNDIDAPITFQLRQRNAADDGWILMLDTSDIGVVGPDTPPSPPDDMDDEFDGTSGLWTWVNQGSATAATSGGKLQVDLPTNGSSNWRHLYQALPSGNWEFRAKFLGLFPTYIWHVMLGVRDSSAQKFCCIGRSYAGAYFAPHVEKWTDPNSYSSNPYIAGSYFEVMHLPYYVSVRYDGTYLYWAWSNSGEEGTYIDLLKETPATWLTAMDQVCLSFMVSDNTVPGRAWVEWFRRTA